MTPTTESATPFTDLRRRTGRRLHERIVHGLLFASAAITIVTTIGIILLLIEKAVAFHTRVPLGDFLFGTRWTPLLEPRSFGVLPLLTGSMMIVVGAALVAIPAGLAIGLYLSEYARERTRRIVKPALEILAGIPTVVYGYFALTGITPLLARVFPETQVFNAASAAIAVGVMILPTVASLCDDSLRAVPDSLRRAAYALGATDLEVSTRIVVPTARSGILAAFVLGITRAFGETMIVTLAAGASPRLTANPLESIQTMTAYIVQVGLGDTPAGTTEYRTIFAVGGLLFAITLTMNFLARLLRGDDEMRA